MGLDLTKTYDFLMAVEQIYPVSSFLRDRYFPTNDATDVFKAQEVLVEYKDGNKKLAPFVAPRKGGVTVTRDGSMMKSYEPPNIAPSRMLTLDELDKRGFGEAIYPNQTPEQRKNLLILQDARDLGDMISRREEAMAAETMLTNGCVMKHIADDETKADEKEIRFYEGENNPAVYTPATPWGTAGAKIRKDLAAMMKMLTDRGIPATDFVCAPDVAELMEEDEEIYRMLDNRRYSLGYVEPKELTAGASVTMQLNINGKFINVISYGETYEDENGGIVQFIPPGHGIVAAPGAGRTLYGAVSQLEESDRDFHTYTGRRIPKYYSDVENNTRKITLTSKPLPVPNNKNPWVAAKLTA